MWKNISYLLKYFNREKYIKIGHWKCQKVCINNKNYCYVHTQTLSPIGINWIAWYVESITENGDTSYTVVVQGKTYYTIWLESII